MPTYIWRKGHHPLGDADVFGRYYNGLRRRHPEVTAEILVQAATRNSSPIHENFEWDNTIAGHAHRLDQARSMMRSIVVYDETTEGPTPPVRYLIAVVPKATTPEPSMKVYIPLREAMADPTRRLEVLMQSIRDLRAFQTKYRQLTELAGVFEAIDKAALKVALTELSGVAEAMDNAHL